MNIGKRRNNVASYFEHVYHTDLFLSENGYTLFRIIKMVAFSHFAMLSFVAEVYLTSTL